ncbi:MAG: yycG 6 [Mucilaginibacter sp.]|nr:yycG 6 [Mucilaginibacter sp.]
MNLQDNAQLRTIVQCAPIGICILDGTTFTVEMLNDKFLEIAGKPREAVLGKWYWEPFAEARLYYEAALSGVVNTGEPYYADEVKLMLIRQGREEWIFVTFVYAPVKNDAGEITKIAVWVLENTTQVLERQKVAEAKLAAEIERDRLYKFFRQAPAGICVLAGPELRYEMVNPRYQEMLPGRELLGRPIFEALPELVGTPLQQVLLDVYHIGESYEINELLIPVAVYEGGPTTDRYFSFTYQARFNEYDQVDGLLAFVIEVTEQVKGRKKAEGAESRLRMAIDAAELGAYHIDTTDRIFYSSGRLKEFFGFAPDEDLPYEAAINQIHKDYRQAAADLVEAAITKGVRFDMEYPVVGYHDKKIRWVRGIGEVQRDPDGKSYFTGVLHDITEKRMVDEKSARLGAIIDSSDDAIISKTLDSVITSWNDSAQRMFGYTADEIIGETIYKLIPADRQEEEPQILSRLKSGDRVEHFETQRLTKDGRLIDVSVSVSPVKDRQGHIIGLSKIARDITEKKQDEVRKNDFIGMVSHELKTPLTSLTAILQVLHLKLKNTPDAFIAGALDKANMQVKKMGNMINGFLNISRLESGKILVDKQGFDMDQLLMEMIEEANITVTTHVISLVSCGPVMLLADRDKIGSVISNLLSNAVKYSPRGKAIEVKCEIKGKDVEVSIKDEGMGVKQQDIHKLFDRYYRVQTNHTQHISGFGIGLYLSAEIIQRHDGKIWVESASGEGSTFYFSLPLSN